jgi:hypothetical protein
MEEFKTNVMALIWTVNAPIFFSVSSFTVNGVECLTPGDHPLSGAPSLFFHPCQTRNWPSLPSPETEHGLRIYVASWLSVVAPHVGLSVSTSFFKRAAVSE